MGKGDRKTKKGKIFMGSYGVSRPKAKNKNSSGAADRPAKPAKAKETKAKPAPETKKTTTKKSTAKKTTTKKSTAKKEDK